MHHTRNTQHTIRHDQHTTRNTQRTTNSKQSTTPCEQHTTMYDLQAINIRSTKDYQQTTNTQQHNTATHAAQPNTSNKHMPTMSNVQPHSHAHQQANILQEQQQSNANTFNNKHHA